MQVFWAGNLLAEFDKRHLEWNRNGDVGEVGEGPRLKTPSVRENTSPVEETVIVSLLRYGRVAYSICQRLFFAFAEMFLRWC